ncbi:NADH-quinone oxidoreductase subunit M [Oscillochloris sp. ZM17-4]|uniref:complex I subunit 4 family protein n=1 Tax=Oscillochloris sp. ZM17-4 TaxID=2866714 RepID=UPI001C731C40|nr:NADH-quinone oxidoreductase subunit M [Oscillochloris sp. ZM17-4]MBX0330588.1 NADH-quinone oxidoreductase subunit M [Oscillochloris sp. ZM17-4]
MHVISLPILSITLWLPALGALALMLTPASQAETQRRIALGFAIAALAAAVATAAMYLTGQASPQGMAEPALPWIPAWGSSYHLGIDGVSIWLVVLAALLAPFAIGATWGQPEGRLRGMLALLLAFESAMLGTFMAQDMLLFYVFWEVALIPAVFLIGIWGGEDGPRAALKMFLYTFSGSVLMLLGIIGVYMLHAQQGATTFDIGTIVADLRSGAFVIDAGVERLLFGAFFAAFAIKLALWPFHTWVPAAYSAAPTPVAIMLAAIMSKFGTYGLIRFNLALFPQASQWAAPAVAILAVIGIIYAATTAFAQTDMQRLVAYSSVSHMNAIALGIFALNAIGISGAVVQMLAHGVNTAALLLLVSVLYERRGTREITAFSGLWKTMPVYGGLTLLVILASMGLPGLNAFIGEFTIMQGTLSSQVLGWPFAGGAVIGVILVAAYMLRMFRIGFMGEARDEGLSDLSRREVIPLALLAVAIVAAGLFPSLLFAPLQGAVDGLVQHLGPATAALARIPR